MLGRAGVQAGDDEANVEPLCRRFDAGAGAALPLPRLGLVAGLGEAAQGGLLVEGAAGADVVGGLFDGTSQYRIAGQSEDEIDTVVFAPSHHLGPAVMAVAANGQVGVRPVFAEAADEAAEMAAHLLAGGRLPGRRMTATGRPVECRRCGSAESSAHRNAH